MDRNPNIISEIVDGIKYKNLFQEMSDKELLALIFYYDDAAPENALGPKSASNNMGYFRFFVANLPRSLTATQKHLHLTAVGFTSDFRDFNYVQILNLRGKLFSPKKCFFYPKA